MSGQWEVVRGKNDRRNKVSAPKTTSKPAETKNKKTNILNNVKLEEVLPKSQVQNLYSGKQNNKENKQEKPKNIEVKKPEKKVKAPPEPPKKTQKIPKSIEAGLLTINSEEFYSVYEKSKKAFPDTPILWLKELTQFLNQKIPVEIQDPMFTNKPQGFPLNVMPSNLKSTIEKAIKDAGKSNAQLYFHIALTSMVTDLGKGLPAVGYRFFLQYIALNEPKLVADNLSKYIILRNSYQNRSNIALSILWAVGHAGINDFKSGLRIFEELMLPLLDMKSYSKFIVKYLLNLVSKPYDTQISKEQYLLILDTIYSSKKNFPVELQKDLIKNLPYLKNLLFKNNKERYHSYVEPFLKRISTNNNSSYQNCLCDIIVESFTKDQSTLASWNKIYTKNLVASATLLNYINKNYDNIQSSVKKSLKDLLISLSNINDELSLKKRKDDGLKEAILSVKKLQERKVTTKRRGSIFRKLFVFFLFISLTFVLTEPLRCPNKAKEDLYIVHFSTKVSNITGTGLNWVDAKLEKSIPDQYKQVKLVLQPYWALARDVGKVAFNIQENVRQTCVGYVKEKYPVVLASVDSYAPGLIDNTQIIFKDACTKSAYYYRTSVDYLQTEVFVGQLSPENIQRVVVQAYNTTSEKAIEYYHWVYEKVQTTIK